MAHGVDQDVAFVRDLLRQSLPPAMADVYLFGSRAKGCARHYSDIDVGVLPKAPLPAGLLAELRERIEQANILLAVDLVDLREADEAFREAVLREGQRWNA